MLIRLKGAREFVLPKAPGCSDVGFMRHSYLRPSFSIVARIQVGDLSNLIKIPPCCIRYKGMIKPRIPRKVVVQGLRGQVCESRQKC